MLEVHLVVDDVEQYGTFPVTLIDDMRIPLRQDLEHERALASQQIALELFHAVANIRLHDLLMRVFGAKRSKLLMNSLGEEPVEHRFLTKAIANAQKKVESQNFEIRKHL